MANNKTINPIVAGVAGAVVGAGLAAASAQALKDPKIKKRAGQLASMARDKANELWNEEKPKVKKAKKTIKSPKRLK